MIAALPMYDFAGTAAANDSFWAELRDRLRADGVAAPDALTRGADLHETWRSPELLFGQTCGYPYWTSLRDQVEILAAPIYAFPGCDGPTHCSFLVVRDDDSRDALAAFRGARAAVNARDSNSGMNLFRASVAPLAGGRPFFRAVIETGAHAASLAAVAMGAADIAAIDCVSYALLAPTGVRVLARTASSPALPFVASRALPPQTRMAVRVALSELLPSPELGLVGVAHLPETAYVRIEDIERGATEAGYPTIG